MDVCVCVWLHFLVSLPSLLLSEHRQPYSQEECCYIFSFNTLLSHFFQFLYYTSSSPLSLFMLPFWCEVAHAHSGLTQTSKLVKQPSPNYSHPPAWLPSALSLLHKHTQTPKCLILSVLPLHNHMSLQYSGQAKSSIIALTYAPLVKGEHYCM